MEIPPLHWALTNLHKLPPIRKTSKGRLQAGNGDYEVNNISWAPKSSETGQGNDWVGWLGAGVYEGFVYDKKRFLRY